MKDTYSQQDLIDFTPKRDVFIGLDSDGCVFDSMTIKQRIFHDALIETWELQRVEPAARKLAEWVGLFSPWRGLNRFQLILKVFQMWDEFLLNEGRPRPVSALAAFVDSGVPLSMTELKKFGNPELQEVYDWSAEASCRIAEVAEMPIFDEAVSGLQSLRNVADVIVVSQTTEEALVREWRNAGLEKYIDVIAGAELGSKAESLVRAAVGRYPMDKIVMIGDAPGDWEAAKEVGCLFYPIVPGDEVASWIELRTVALSSLVNGTFAGAYQAELFARFEAALSVSPPNVG